MAKRWFVFLVLIMVAETNTSLIAGNGGSGYSRYGLGDIRFSPSTRLIGMGGISMAVMGQTDINSVNPATWTKLANTRILGSFMYEGISTTDGVNSAYLASGNFNGFTLAMPLSRANGISVALGFNPYSSVNYRVRTTDSQSGEQYQLDYSGSGGLSNGWVGISATPFENFHIGTIFHYLFGSISNSWIVNFSNTGFYNTENTRTTNLSGVNFTLGTIYSGLGKLIQTGNNDLNIGFTVSTPTNLIAKRETIYRYISGYDTTKGQDGSVSVPIAYGVGVSYVIKDKYTFGLDYYAQNWGSFESFGVKPSEIRDSYRIGIGSEMLPDKEASESFFKRLIYRFGAYYNASYYQVRNEPLNEYFLTAGIGIPLFFDTRLDVALEYGTRGKTDNLLQKDNIIRLGVSINAGELWFAKRED